MELRVFWTDTARFQLEDIFNYYKDKASIRVARKLVKQIIDRTIQLEKNPNSGPKEPLLTERKVSVLPTPSCKLICLGLHLPHAKEPEIQQRSDVCFHRELATKWVVPISIL